MHEQEYLADADVAAFTAFVRKMTIDGCPEVVLRVGSGRHRRDVSNLLDAVDAYSWFGEPFSAIYTKTEAIRQEIHAALERCSAAGDRDDRRLAELELLFVSTKALSLGRSYEGAFPFLIHQAETGVLSENLRAAAALIDGATEQVDPFDDRPYRSDCAMTKVYAVMNRRTVVYDDRLGAALGLLCRCHLERERRRSIPQSLAFMVGDDGDALRNPSCSRFRFPDKRSGREHARWNLRANWILSRLAVDPLIVEAMGGEFGERIRRLEAALFVIGDDVRDQPRIGGGTPTRAPRHVVVPLSAINGGKPASR